MPRMGSSTTVTSASRCVFKSRSPVPSCCQEWVQTSKPATQPEAVHVKWALLCTCKAAEAANSVASGSSFAAFHPTRILYCACTCTEAAGPTVPDIMLQFWLQTLPQASAPYT